MRQLEIQGPVWRAPSVREVLRGLPFLHHVPPDMFDWMLERGQLLGEFCGGSSGRPVVRSKMRRRRVFIYGLVYCFVGWQRCRSGSTCCNCCCRRPNACAEYTSGEVIWAPAQPGAGRGRELGLFIVG